MRWLYLALDLGALAGPLALSFDRRVAFYRRFWPVLGAILSMMVVMVPLDMAFVKAQIWGFRSEYTCGLQLGNLPLEEWLFFPVVGYACLFIYECLRAYGPENPLSRWHRPILWLWAISGLGLALLNPLRLYTSIKLGGTAVAILVVLYGLRPRYLGRFVLMYLVSVLPFLLMNGVLTGSGIPGEVVWYNEAHILGVRLGTIPLEDLYYSLLMLLIATVAYERLLRARG